MKYFIGLFICLLWIVIIIVLKREGIYADCMLEMAIMSISIGMIPAFTLKLFNTKKAFERGQYWVYFLLEAVRLFAVTMLIFSFSLFISSDEPPLFIKIVVGSGIPMMLYLFVQTSRRVFKSWNSYRHHGEIEVDEKYR